MIEIRRILTQVEDFFHEGDPWPPWNGAIGQRACHRAEHQEGGRPQSR